MFLLLFTTCHCLCPCVYVCLCVVLSGKYYGCIVRKKVMLLEELKRDTSEFGGFGRAASLLCVCLSVHVFGLAAFMAEP